MREDATFEFSIENAKIADWLAERDEFEAFDGASLGVQLGAILPRGGNNSMRHTRKSRHWFAFAAALTCTAMMLFAPVRHRVAARAEVLQSKPPGSLVSQGGGISVPSGGKFSAESANTATPIKHLIVIVGENHTFDNVFATYKPQSGQTVLNLLSERIVSDDGSPGSKFSLAQQN